MAAELHKSPDYLWSVYLAAHRKRSFYKNHFKVEKVYY